MMPKVNHKTKTDAVLHHLMSGRTITQLEAIQEYSLFRLPVIVASLRKAGFNIACEMREAANGTKYGRYSLNA